MLNVASCQLNAETRLQLHLHLRLTLAAIKTMPGRISCTDLQSNYVVISFEAQSAYLTPSLPHSLSQSLSQPVSQSVIQSVGRLIHFLFPYNLRLTRSHCAAYATFS